MTLEQLALYTRCIFAGPAAVNPMFKFWLDLWTAPHLTEHRGRGSRHAEVPTNLAKLPPEKERRR